MVNNNGKIIKSEVFFEDPETTEEKRLKEQRNLDEIVKKIPSPTNLSKGMLYSAYGSQIARLVITSEEIN